MPSKPSTIYDLAEIAGVSASTVSAVLNGNWRDRRIADATALKVQRLAEKHKYSINRQASGLRKSRSGLAAMIIPLHDNRFFSAMAQAFEARAREHGWQPIVVSTLRDPELEISTVKTLMSYRVEHLIIAGATNPDAVGRVCKQHGVPYVNVDLPGHTAPSVISDNYWGSAQLTTALVDRSSPQRDVRRDRAYFIGGLATDYATQRRIQAFTDVVRQHFGALSSEQIDACGYEGDLAEAAVRRLYERIGGLPRILLVNSTIALEGVVRLLKTLPAQELDSCAIGCYDWDPFASMLSFPMVMVRQDVDGLLREAFKLLDAKSSPRNTVIEIKPELLLP